MSAVSAPPQRTPKHPVDTLKTPPSIARAGWRAPLAPVAVVLAIIVVWEAVVRALDIRVQVLPAPSRIVTSGVTDAANLMSAAKVTGLEALIGLAAAITFGVLTAYLLFLLPAVERSVQPLLVVSQTIPMVALAPLMVIWFGFEPIAKVLIVALFGYFPIVVALGRGLSSPRQEQIDVARTLGASQAWVLVHVRSRAAFRQLMSGIRIAVTYAPATAAMAEFVGARNGLGVYLLSSQSSFRTDLVFAGAITLTLMTLLLYLLVASLERLASPWHKVASS